MRHILGYALFCATSLAFLGFAHERLISHVLRAFDLAHALLSAAGGGH